MTHRRALWWLLGAEGVSLAGSRVTFLAVPWFVLETTGSPARTGVVVFAEMVPYVGACALGGPLVDRRGPRWMSVATDVAGAIAIALVPVLFRADLLPFALLVVVMGAAGGLRGLGDTAKRTLFPAAVEASGVDLTRATSARDGTSRLAEMLGAPVAGLLIAGIGAANVLLVDAASFAVTAAIVAGAVRVATPGRTADDEPYGAALRAGLAYLRRDELVLGLALMILATNLLDTAYLTVFAPVWAHEVGSAKALGLVFGAFGAGAVAGNLLFTALATRLPRYGTFAVCFLLGGAPHMVVMATTDAVWPVAAVLFLSGFVCAPVNPILSAVAYERIPPELQARVIGLIRALAWAGIPLGGLLGGLLVAHQGLTTALVLAAVLYFAITLVPFTRPRWRELSAA